MRNGRKTIFSYVYGWALIFFVLSLPLSMYAMSLASFLLLAVWIWADIQLIVIVRFFRQKGFFRGFYFLILYLFRTGRSGIVERAVIFWRNKAAVVFASIFLIFVLGLIKTTDFSNGFGDLRVKLPLLLFPLLFASLEKIDYQTLKRIFFFFILGLFAATMVGSYILLKGDYVNVRQISPFVSSVRLGLSLSFGFFILLYFITKEHSFSGRQKILMGVLAIWFLVFLYFMESLTAFATILLVGFSYLLYQVFATKKKLTVKVAFVILAVGIPASIYFYVKKEVRMMTTAPKINFQKLDKFTALGDPYVFDTTNFGIEDGKYVGMYLCIPELRQSWDKRSKLPYDGLDKEGNHLSQTLIRYLTSKNLRKDAGGVAALSRVDIQRIENGIANYNYVVHPGLHSRLLKIVKGYEVYKYTGNAGGNSLFQRIVYFKAALNIIKAHFWTGVGTGNLKSAFHQEFNKMHAQLDKKYMHLSHNQYLTVFVALGVFGFLFFIFALIYPVILTKSYRDYFFMVFYSIMLISFLSDDNLETHVGVSLFAFFSSLLMFGIQQKSLPKTKS